MNKLHLIASFAFALTAATALGATGCTDPDLGTASGRVIIDQSLATDTVTLASLQRVAGAAADLTFATSDQRLTLQVDATHWFDQADFAALLGTTEVDGRYTWDQHSTFHNQLLQGLRSSSGVYSFSLAPQGGG